jgi:hypothetical protein
MNRFLTLPLMLALVAGMATAQCTVLPVITASGNAQNGYMFDVENISAGNLTVAGFAVFGYTATDATFEIYTLNVAGSYLANLANLTTAANWTLVGSAQGFAMTTGLSPVPIPIAVNVAPGTRQAFYLTCQTGANVSYTSGLAQLNTVIASDTNLQVYGGNGKAYPFGATFGGTAPGSPGRLFVGSVTYLTGVPSYETNSPAASLVLDGVQTTGCVAATSAKCFGATTTVTLSSTNVGAGWELAIGLANLVPVGGGAFVTANNQSVNVDLADPTLTLLHNLTLPPFPSPFPGGSPLVLTFAAPPIATLTAQLLVLDPAHPDGFSLSQAIQLNSQAPLSPIPGPNGDDVAMTIVAGAPPLCAPPLIVYGTVHNTYEIISNGRITWPVVSTSNQYLSTVAAAMADPGQFGAWVDLNTGIAGNITIDLANGILGVNYNGVGYNYQTGTASSFRLEYNSNNGVISILNFAMGPQIFNNTNQFLGISRGAGATNPGQATFSPAGSGVTVNGTDMLYNFGLAGTLVPGITSTVFYPNAFNNYDFVTQ